MLNHTLKRNELEPLFKGMVASTNVQGAKFSYFITKNISKVIAELKKRDKIAAKKRPEQTEQMNNFAKEEDVLLQEFAKKDARGNAIKNERGYDVDDTRIEEFDGKLKEIQIKYPEATEVIGKFNEWYNAYNQEDITFEFHTLDIKDIPEGVTANNLTPIEFLIVD